MNSVSVIIPYFESANYLERCLNSVLIQQVNLEVILIDDCSTSPVPSSIINKFLLLGLDVRVITLVENIGPGGARFLGLLKAKNDYIAFLDSDDEWLEDKLRLQLDFIEKTNSNCIGSKVLDLNYINNTETERGHFYSRKSFLVDLLQNRISVPMSSIIIKRKCLLDQIHLLKGDSKLFNLDHFELLVIMSSLKFSFIDVVLCIYKIHGDNISLNNKYHFHYSSFLFSLYKNRFNSKRIVYFYYAVIYYLKGVFNV